MFKLPRKTGRAPAAGSTRARGAMWWNLGEDFPAAAPKVAVVAVVELQNHLRMIALRLPSDEKFAKNGRPCGYL